MELLIILSIGGVVAYVLKCLFTRKPKPVLGKAPAFPKAGNKYR